MNCDRVINDTQCNIIIQNDPWVDQYVTVYILQWNPTDRTQIQNQMFIKETKDDEVVFTIGKDGFYTICDVSIPKSKDKSCYFDKGNFYLNNKEVSVQEIINTDPEITGVKANYEYYFSTCQLRKCYVNYAKQIIDSHNGSICSPYNLDQNIIYKRDLVWSALNVIKYMIEFDQYEEAQRLLERIQGCNGLCEYKSNNGGSCGCGRR